MGDPAPNPPSAWLISTCPACSAKLRFRAAEAAHGSGKCPACGGRVPAVGAKPPRTPKAERARPERRPWASLRTASALPWTLWRDVYSFPWQHWSNARIWLVLATGMAAVAGLAAYGHLLEHRWTHHGDVPVIGIVIHSALLLCALGTASFAAVPFLAIVQDTASGEHEVAWPEVTFADRLVQVARLAWVACGSALPVAGLALLFRVPVPAGGIGWSVASLPVVVFFPLLLLAALSNNSWWVWDSDTLLSILRRPLALAGVWLASAVMLFACTWLGHEIIGGFRYRLVLFAGPIWAAALLIYARSLGRLARLAARTEGKRRRRRKRQETFAAERVPVPSPSPRRPAGVVVQCSACAGWFEIPREQAGQRCSCPHCQATTIPERAPSPQKAQETHQPASAPADRPEAAVLKGQPGDLQPLEPRPEEESAIQSSSPVYKVQPGSSDPPVPARAPAPAQRAPRATEPKKPRRTPQWGRAPAKWLGFTYPILGLFLLPLLFYLPQEHVGVEQRLRDTVARQPEQVTGQIAGLPSRGGKKPLEAVLRVLPANRLDGALLPRRTWLHWAFGIASAALFVGMLLVIFPGRTAPLPQLLLIGLLTSTVGLLFLFGVQYLAVASIGMPWFGGSGFAIVASFFLKLVGFSYLAALDPNVGLVGSAAGFTLGVGLCEELCKAFPMIQDIRHNPRMEWQGFCRWGLASGIGFGVAEAIRYSAEFYNGLEPGGVYVVRFLSCVALHAIWAAAAGIMLYRERALFRGPMAWHQWVLPLLAALGVPMVLHGLYDTLLKKQLHQQALIVAVVSFAWLAFLIETTRRYVPEEEADFLSNKFRSPPS